MRGRTHDSVLKDRRFTMPLPNISAAQISWVIQQVASYIDMRRQTYRRWAVPLDRNQKTIIQPFFPEPTLDSARVVVLAGERVSNPSFYGELVKMGFEAGSLPDFAEMAAITFVDTVASHGPYDNRTLFHELVRSRLDT